MMTISMILGTVQDLKDYGLWATYANLRGYHKTKRQALWIVWVAWWTKRHMQ